MEPDAVEVRVLGCLLEKQRTTPYAYPLSLNSLRVACNQPSSRNPVVKYEESEIAGALRRLSARGWVGFADRAGNRVPKYRHLLDEALDLDAAELSLLALLMLRGVQTPGELKHRTERLYGFDDLGEVHERLEHLADRGHVVRLVRQVGQKEDRYEQRLGQEGNGDTGEPSAPEREASDRKLEAGSAPPAGASEAVSVDRDGRLDWLEAEVVKLRAQVAALRDAIDK